MKKIICLIMLLLSLSVLVFTGCGKREESYLRIHIRANSNLEADQNIKYKVKDELVNYLTPQIAQCNNFSDVVKTIEDKKTALENLCNKILKENGFEYVSKVCLQNEYFPTRAYGEYVLESDFYDAVIVELGSAKGDNWWCVVYPPLCFINAKELDSTSIKYKSKIYELIKNFFD